MDDPDWSEWVKFDQTFRLSDLLANRSLLPTYGGFYAWSLDRGSLKQGRVLYVGKTEDKGGFRSRFSDYLRANPHQPQAKAHSAALFLQDHYLRKTTPSQIWVHIAPFEGAPALINQLEKAIMQYYLAWYNKAGMRSHTQFDTL